jgi:hypothetical protein
VYIEQTLNEEKRQIVRDLLCSYPDVASMNPSSPNTTTAAMHEINTGSAKPINMLPHRVCEAAHTIMDNEVDNMLVNRIIEPARGEWCASVVLVKKKDGTYRFCVDYRKVNAVTEKDVYNLPNMHDILEHMRKACIFTKADLAAGYWQVLVHPRDRAKTAFATRKGLFQFIRMPFGLCNAPATFQRMMNAVLHDLIGVCVYVYIDDIIIYSTSFEMHMQHLKLVLDRLRAASLQVKAPHVHG